MLQTILTELEASNTQLVAVSKTRPDAAVLALYEQGQRVFGENRVQEIVGKYERMPKDISWHLIGHLQTNKVKYIAPFVQMIHSIDSGKLLREVNKQAAKNDRVIEVLLQCKIAEEESKYGFDEQQIRDLLEAPDFATLKHIRVRGLMGMATFTDDQDQVRAEFKALKKQFDQIKSSYFPTDPDFDQLSMGMSGDYRIAIEEGSTMVRIGSLLF